MQSDIRMGRIFGVEIFISYSWFLIFALVTTTLAFGYFPSQFPDHSVTVNIVIGGLASFFFFASLLFHEMSHSLVANRNGIPIKRITLFIFGGMAQMSEEPRDAYSEFKMAIAGPSSSFFLAGLFYTLYQGFIWAGLPSPLYAAFGWLAQINFFLAIFNLAPGFPLDGGRVLRATIWHFTKNLEIATNVASKTGQAVGLAMVGLGVLMFLTGQIGGVWLILVGWFLNQSAVASYRQVMLQQSLVNVDVENIMSPEVRTVSPDLVLEELVNHYFLRHRVGRFPVVNGVSLLGVVTLHDVKDVPRENWATETVGQIMEPIDEGMFVTPGDAAVKALGKMAEHDIGHLMVVDDKKNLVGIVTRADIVQLIKVRSELDI